MAKTEANPPLRVGAKAKKLIAESGKSEAALERAVKKAESLARANGDRMLRDYYLYEALGMEMPERTREQWEYFKKHGKEMPASGGNGAKTERKAATPKRAASNPPTSGEASFKPHPKPSSGRSKKRSGRKSPGNSEDSPSTGSTTDGESASESGSLPSSDDVLSI